MKRIAGISLILLGTVTPASAEPPAVEWSSWVRLGYGLAQQPEDGAQPRLVEPPAAERSSRWEAGLGADASLAIGDAGDLRLGGWGEARTSSLPVAGIELVVAGAPDKLDMFFFEGEGVLIVRGGGNHEVLTGAISYGYRAPWNLFGPWPGATRYMIGVRLVASATRAIDDPADWSVTAGLEFEPVGALRYVLGIRSWY